MTSLVPRPGVVLLAWAAAGVLTLIGALVCAELASAYPAHRRRLRLLQGNLLADARLPLGLGDVLDDAQRHPGGDRDGVRPLCRVLRAARSTPARGWWRSSRDPGAVGDQLRRRAVRQPRADGVHGREGGGGAWRSSVLGWALGGPRAGAGVRRLRPISAGNFLLAVGAGLFAFGGWHMVTYTAEETVDPDAHHSALADDRHRRRHGLLHRPERRVPARAADRPGDGLDARRGRYVRRADRRRGGGRDLGAGDVQRVRRAQRHRAGRAARLLPDGAGRPVVPFRGPPASALPDARSRDHRCRRCGRRCW